MMYVQLPTWEGGGLKRPTAGAIDVAGRFPLLFARDARGIAFCELSLFNDQK